MLREALERHLVDLGLDLGGGGAVKAPSSPRKSGGHPSVGNLGRRGEEGYSPEKSRSPSFVSAFFPPCPSRYRSSKSDSSNSCLQPQTLASTCSGVSS